jgi:hypothetical protein
MKSKFSQRISFPQFVAIALIFSLLFGCSVDTPSITAPTSLPTEEIRTDGLTDEEAATLTSLVKIDDYPLYTMHYYGNYDQWRASTAGGSIMMEMDLRNPDLATWPSTWACSLFAALGDAGNMLYGRNFDWEHSPAVLLFTAPPDGYASVSMVDIAYLGFNGAEADALTDLPLSELEALLDTPFLPFDGMNEQGLTIGMAAVPPGHMLPDPQKETVDSVMIIRLMLDRASTVDEAVAILKSYNIDMGGGPPIHYLIADASGRSVLVEFYQGEVIVIPNETPWHLATNFLRASYGASAEGVSWRYDSLFQQLSETEGYITPQEAMDLLKDVSQANTQWSIVYGMSTGDIIVSMERQYDNVYTFTLDQPSQQEKVGCNKIF